MEPASTPPDVPVEAQDPSQRAELRAALVHLRQPTTDSTPALYVVLLLMFLWSQLDGLHSVSGVVVLVAVLLFHEAGHALGMRMFGFANVRMFFIPFLGAAVSGRPRGAAAWKDAVVSLLGPLPGLVLAPLLMVAVEWVPHRMLWDTAQLMFVLNAFNLLPLGSLDGGRFLQRVIFSRHRVLETLFSAVGSVAMFALAYAMDAVALMVFAALGLLALPARYRLLQNADTLRRGMPDLDPDPGALTDADAFHLLRLSQSSLPEEHRQNARTIAERAEALLDGMRRPPGLGASVALLGVYAVAWVAVVAGAVGLAMSADGAPATYKGPGFTVRMPSAHAVSAVPVATPAGERRMVVARGTLGRVERFTASALELPEGMDAAAAVAWARHDLQERSGLRVQAEVPAGLGLQAGVEWRLQGRMRVGRARAVVRERTLVVLAVTSPEESERADPFFDSLVWAGEAPPEIDPLEDD